MIPINKINKPQLARFLISILGPIFSLTILLTVAACGQQATSTPTASSNSSRSVTAITRPPITCTTPQHVAGNSNLSITSGGLNRTFILHLPPSYGKQPQPLVINYHAWSVSAQNMAKYTNMGAEADKAGFIVVFPQGVDTPYSWNAGIGAEGPTGDADDVQFTRDMLSFLEKNYCVDIHRIYVTGWSLGGGMAYRVACTLSNQITAIATVAGAYYQAPGGCHPSRPMPVLEIHGQADRFAPYDGNPGPKMASVQAYLNVWLTNNRCSGTNSVFFQQGDVTGIDWTHCADGSVVVHYRISDGGHTWPGASPNPNLGYTTDVIDANVVIWNFFSQFKLP
jgi:polyhydroxybutyrate depolymerase